MDSALQSKIQTGKIISFFISHKDLTLLDRVAKKLGNHKRSKVITHCLRKQLLLLDAQIGRANIKAPGDISGLLKLKASRANKIDPAAPIQGNPINPINNPINNEGELYTETPDSSANL